MPLWTERALERAGFRVAEDAPTCVEIIRDNDDAVWRPSHGDRRSRLRYPCTSWSNA